MTATPALVLVDAGHLVAAVGRSSGRGAARRRGEIDVVVLLRELHALLPRALRGGRTVWFDGLVIGVEDEQTESLQVVPGVTVVTLPVRGGRQRHVEAAVLREALLDRAEVVYLVGDPRRHAVTVQTLHDAGRLVRLVGVSDGETTPAERLWLRRPEVLRAVAAPRGVARRRPEAGYQRPEVRGTPVRLPLPKTAAPGPTSTGEAAR